MCIRDSSYFNKNLTFYFTVQTLLTEIKGDTWFQMIKILDNKWQFFVSDVVHFLCTKDFLCYMTVYNIKINFIFIYLFEFI